MKNGYSHLGEQLEISLNRGRPFSSSRLAEKNCLLDGYKFSDHAYVFEFTQSVNNRNRQIEHTLQFSLNLNFSRTQRLGIYLFE